MVLNYISLILFLQMMTQYGIEVRDWWGKPVYSCPHFLKSEQNKSGSSFPISDLLSSKVIGLPMGDNITKIQQEYIVKSLTKVTKSLN